MFRHIGILQVSSQQHISVCFKQGKIDVEGCFILPGISEFPKPYAGEQTDSPWFFLPITSFWSCAYRTHGVHLYFICCLLNPPIQNHLMTAHPVPVSHRTTGCLTVALHKPELHWLRPRCGLTMGDRSHLKEGKQWKNRQEKTSLVGRLKNVDIFREILYLTPFLLPKSNNWTLLTDVALGLMFCCFCSCHTVQNW